MTSPNTVTSADDFRTFPLKIKGRVRSRHHPEYAGWHRRLAWNGRSFERYPEYIVKVGCEADIVQAINFARTHRMRISVRGGGHSYSGSFLREGGILLDLSALQEISVDAAKRRAAIEPGVTSHQLSERLATHGLAFPTGHGSDVALSGFLLGGGLGINCAAWGGMSVFNVLALDVVTADGRVRHLSPDSEPDLFWAARGGGPTTFFVVTRFYVACHPLPHTITGNTYRVPFGKLGPLLTQIERIDPAPALQTMLAVIPCDTATATEYRRECVLSTIAFAENAPQASTLHAALVSKLPVDWLIPVEEGVASGFEVIYRQSDAMMTAKRYRTDNILTDRAEDAVRILASHLPYQPSPATVSLFIWRGTRTFPDASYSARGKFFLSTYAQWNDAVDDEANSTWLKCLYDELATVASGHYINEFDIETRAADIARCFSTDSWRRLCELRRHYDPEGVFHDVAELTSMP